MRLSVDPPSPGDDMVIVIMSGVSSAVYEYEFDWEPEGKTEVRQGTVMVLEGDQLGGDTDEAETEDEIDPGACGPPLMVTVTGGG
jgi:hypothetical protein